MAKYDDEFKLNAVDRVHSGETQKDVAADLGLSPATLGDWMKKAADNVLGKNQSKPGVDADDRLVHVAATHGMDDDQLAEYADNNDVSVQSLTDWHAMALSGLSDQHGDFADPVQAMNQAMQQIARENRELEKRLEKIKSMI